jgi:two-component system, repressor protein LuxO
MALLERSRNEILERIAADLIRPLKVVQRETVERAMILCEGDVDEAAARLKISRTTLYRMLRAWKKEDS